MEEKQAVSLSELEAKARKALAKKAKPAAQSKAEPEKTAITPVEELPVQEVSKGGGHLKKKDSEELSEKDIQVLTMLACGVEKTVAANIAGVDRKTIYRLLDSERVDRMTKAAKKRLTALAPLAVEIIHSELVKGNVEVAQQVLKGLAIMRTSVNNKDASVKERSIAEEILENDGRVTRRVTKERND